MGKGFYSVMGAQFFSSLADNALLLVCIYYLTILAAPDWISPLLKLFFVLSYVLLAPFVGAFADAYPKGRVMFYTNVLKVCGCALLFTGIHPLFAYALVGLGAAAYSPAKYGILTEIVEAKKLVVANGWVEGLTVSSIILGVMLGSFLTSKHFTEYFMGPQILKTMPISLVVAICVLILVYGVAAVINLLIPDTGARYGEQAHSPLRLVQDFAQCCKILWQDRLGQITLAATTIAWGVGAALQFIILKWASVHLDMSVSRASLLLGVFAIGMTVGAVIAARTLPLHRSLEVLRLRYAISGLIILMAFTHTLQFGYLWLILAGTITGYFIVPMNALLQHRGYVLLSAGHSIAVQNFNENLAILLFIGFYALLLKLDLPIDSVMLILAGLTFVLLHLVARRNVYNQKNFDSLALINEQKKLNAQHDAM